MDNEVISDEYATKDMHLAAFLIIKGIEIKKLEKYSHQKSPVYFIFDNQQRCMELENTYWNGGGEDALINIKDYTSTLRDLRIRTSSVAMVVKKTSDSWKGGGSSEDNQDLHF